MGEDSLDKLFNVLLPYVMKENPELFNMDDYEQAKRISDEILDNINLKFEKGVSNES